MVIWSRDVRVRLPVSWSTVGASIGFATGLSLHAPSANAPIASAMVVYRFIELSLGLESDIETHEECLARRIRCHVLEPPKGLVSEVRDLWIETCILRPGSEVPSADL